MENNLQDFVQIFDAVSGVSKCVFDRKPTVDFTGAEETAPRSKAPGAQFRILASEIGAPEAFRRAVLWQLATLASSMDIASVRS
jgi:hypothetical protein